MNPITISNSLFGLVSKHGLQLDDIRRGRHGKSDYGRAPLGSQPLGKRDRARWPGRDCLLGRGRAFAMNEKWERAIADHTKAIESDPTLIDAYVYRGRAHTELKFDDGPCAGGPQ